MKKETNVTKTLKEAKNKMSLALGLLTLAFSLAPSVGSAAAWDESSLGTLVVEGVRAPSQSPTVELYRCTQLRNGEPVKGSCRFAKSGLLPYPLRNLVPGHYLVVNGNSIAQGLTEIRAGETKTLKFAPLEFPQTRETYSYEVFTDLTNGEMQERFLRFIWGTADAEAIVDLCQSTTPADHKAAAFCRAWEGDDFSLLRGAMVQFFSEGYYSIVNRVRTVLKLRYERPRILTIEYLLVRFSAIEKLITATPESGDTVGVFPGVYGVTLKLPHDEDTILGVRAW
jgi:hypothetical protein